MFEYKYSIVCCSSQEPLVAVKSSSLEDFIAVEGIEKGIPLNVVYDIVVD